MKLRLAPWLLLPAAALALSARAGEPPAPAPAQPVDESIAVAEFNGMKVAVDKATGKLRPLTAEESRELDEMLTRQGQASRRGPSARPATDAAAVATTRTLTMGGTAMKLPESQLEYLSAARDAEGNLVLTHSSEADAGKEPVHE